MRALSSSRVGLRTLALPRTRGGNPKLVVSRVPAKSRAVVLRLETKWLHFLERHGEEYKWDASG